MEGEPVQCTESQEKEVYQERSDQLCQMLLTVQGDESWELPLDLARVSPDESQIGVSLRENGRREIGENKKIFPQNFASRGEQQKKWGGCWGQERSREQYIFRIREITSRYLFADGNDGVENETLMMRRERNPRVLFWTHAKMWDPGTSGGAASRQKWK